MAKSKKKIKKQKRQEEMDKKFLLYAILGTIVLLVLYFIISNIGS